jgi:hypothetical protein
MTKEEAGQLAEKLGNLAGNILLQLNGHEISGMVSQYYVGILMRQRIILKDISVILKNNQERNITSAFVLFRVLLDNFVRLFSVLVDSNPEDIVTRLKAEAYEHELKTMKLSYEINDRYYYSQHPSLFTITRYKKEVEDARNAMEINNLFSNQTELKWKRPVQIAQVFETLDRNNLDVKANVHSYVIYKHLSKYVHYSNLTYNIENTPNYREMEIKQLEELLFYSYKTIAICFSFFGKQKDLIWNDPTIIDFFYKTTMSMKLIDCTTREGALETFQYSYAESSIDGIPVINFFIIPFDANEHLEFFSFQITLINDRQAKVTVMNHHNHPNYKAKGIPERMILEVAKITGLQIISSTNNPAHKVLASEFQTPPATKAWERLLTKGRAQYDVSSGIYSLNT